MPRFSVVTPVYNPPADILRACLRSVAEQTLSDWEHLLVDDASTQPHVRQILDAAAAADPRVKVLYRSENGGIVAASNDGLDLATGELVGLLDHDDEIVPEALAAMHEAFASDETIDVAYSDEDHLDPEGMRIHPFYKPDFSPERLRAQNYICHFLVTQRALITEVGGFRRRLRRQPGLRPRPAAHREGAPRVTTCRGSSTTGASWPARSRPTCSPSRTPTRPGARRCRSTATASASTPSSRNAICPAPTASGGASQGEPLVSVIIPTRGPVGRVVGGGADLRRRGGARPRRALDVPAPRVRRGGRHGDTAGGDPGARAGRRRPAEARLVRPAVQLRREDERRRAARGGRATCCSSTTTSS